MAKRTHAQEEDGSRWTPRHLPGGVYCSPACGNGCTIAEFNNAERDAASLCARMGDGWEPVIWENLGWHYMAAKGLFKITPPTGSRDAYIAWFQGSGSARHDTGNGTTQFLAYGDTPEQALGLLKQDMRTFTCRLTQALDDLES